MNKKEESCIDSSLNEIPMTLLVLCDFIMQKGGVKKRTASVRDALFEEIIGWQTNVTIIFYVQSF